MDRIVVFFEGAFQFDGVFHVARLAHDSHLDTREVTWAAHHTSKSRHQGDEVIPSLDVFQDKTFERKYLDAEDVALEPSSFMQNVLDTDAQIGQKAGQFGNAARSVADCDAELDQTAVYGQTAVQAPAQHRRVDVATAQWDHHSFT